MSLYEFGQNGITPVDKTTFSQAGLQERRDLQRLLRDHVEVIAPETLVISEEFGDWEDSRRRIDLLGYDDPVPEGLVAIIKKVLAAEKQGGILFDADGVRISRIQEDNQYGSLRLRTTLALPAFLPTSTWASALQRSWLPKSSAILSCSTCRHRACAATLAKLSSQRSSRRWWPSG